MTIVTMSACTKCLVQNWQILLKRRIPDKDYTQDDGIAKRTDNTVNIKKTDCCRKTEGLDNEKYSNNF